MARTAELPELVKEFADMSKEYLRQETIEPAKQLGRFGGVSIAAGFVFALGTLLLAIATARSAIEILPEGPYWEALGYVIALGVIGLVSAILVKAGSRKQTRIEPARAERLEDAESEAT